MREREFYVLEVSTCESCGGRCFLTDEWWDEARAAGKAAEEMALERGAIQYEADQEEQEAILRWWADQDYYPPRIPPEEYPCPECEGEGRINRRVTLAEALAALAERESEKEREGA